MNVDVDARVQSGAPAMSAGDEGVWPHRKLPEPEWARKGPPGVPYTGDRRPRPYVPSSTLGQPGMDVDEAPPLGREFVSLNDTFANFPDRKQKPLNGHRGYYSYHDDDCRCAMYGEESHCNRNGYIWSCCGQWNRYSVCFKS
eukprot:tig00000169_g11898.t1